MHKFVDTHTHLFVEEFDTDRDAAVERAVEAGVTRLCLPCINITSIEPIKAMCEKHKGVCYPMIGLHPTDVKEDYKTQLSQMRNLLSCDDSFIAVGEVGLDFYWDTTYREQQFEALEEQIAWAREFNLPLVIHSRSASDELYEVMNKHRGESLRGIFHCFSGDADEARRLLSLEGFMLGIGGTLTYKKSILPAVLKEIVPLERIVLETDSPYLAPVPFRGRRNESAYVPQIAKFLSEIYNVSDKYIAEVTTANAESVFTKMIQL